MNRIQHAIFASIIEESGLWELLIDIADDYKVSRREAFDLLKSEINYIKSREDIFFIKSQKLYDSESSEILDKDLLLKLCFEDIEFNESGPFYYLQACPASKNTAIHRTKDS